MILIRIHLVNIKTKNSNVISLGFFICDKDCIIDYEKDGLVHEGGHNILSSLVKRRINHYDDVENTAW